MNELFMNDNKIPEIFSKHLADFSMQITCNNVQC